jgi:hypothetical protein
MIGEGDVLEYYKIMLPEHKKSSIGWNAGGRVAGLERDQRGYFPNPLINNYAMPLR